VFLLVEADHALCANVDLEADNEQDEVERIHPDLIIPDGQGKVSGADVVVHGLPVCSQ
jgi:hypothetical protein